MVHPQMQQAGISASHQHQPQDQTIDQLRGGSGGGATMPRLSSGSLRSTGSHTSGNYIFASCNAHRFVFGEQKSRWEGEGVK